MNNKTEAIEHTLTVYDTIYIFLNNYRCKSILEKSLVDVSIIWVDFIQSCLLKRFDNMCVASTEEELADTEFEFFACLESEELETLKEVLEFLNNEYVEDSKVIETVVTKAYIDSLLNLVVYLLEVVEEEER